MSATEARRPGRGARPMLFQGRALRRTDELPRLTAKTPVGSEITLAVLRGGQEMAVKVKLGELPETPER